jgi:hypothetical protein
VDWVHLPVERIQNSKGFKNLLLFVFSTRAGEDNMPYQLDHIDPTKTVMIVVDMQNDFVADGAKLRSAAAAAMVPKLASTLNFCRENGIRVVYTAHVHRRDGSDMGLYDDLYPPIAARSTLVDGTSGTEIRKHGQPCRRHEGRIS